MFQSEYPEISDELWVRAVHNKNQVPIDKSNGRACIINGTIVYSPNCSRFMKSGDFGANHVTYDSRKHDVVQLHRPRLWSPEYTFLAFMETDSVSSGPLGWILRDKKRFPTEGKKTVRMHSEDVLRWNRLQFDLRNASEHLIGLTKAPCGPDLIETALTCNAAYQTVDDLNKAIERSREWFAYWIAKTAYAIAVCESVQDLEMLEGKIITDKYPIQWFRSMVEAEWYQGFISCIRSACCARPGSMFDANTNREPTRVGVLIDICHPKKNQPPIQWFIENGVPVWYEWFPQQTYLCSFGDALNLRPEPEHLQQAATIMLKEMDTRGDIMNSNVRCQSFELFCIERERRADIIKKGEDDAAREKREESKRRKAFIWKKRWNVYYRCRLPDEDIGNAIRHYQSNGRARYDDITGEWDLCSATSDSGREYITPPSSEYEREDTSLFDIEDEHTPSQCSQYERTSQTLEDSGDESMVSFGDEEDLPYDQGALGSLNGYQTLHASHQFYTQATVEAVDVQQYEPLHILHELMGYVPTIGDTNEQPRAFDIIMRRAYCKLIGMERTDVEFFQSAGATEAANFIDTLASTTQSTLPRADIWDLHRSNRLALSGYDLAKKIFKLRRKDGDNNDVLYVFDYGSHAIMNCMVGVESAIAAAKICRSNSNDSDFAMCKNILQQGIHFSALCKNSHEGDTLTDYKMRLKPMRMPEYTFTKDDYAAYMEEISTMFSVGNLAGRALKVGGIVWRIAVAESFSTVLQGEWTKTASSTLYISDDGTEYFDDTCTEEEMDAICGVYSCPQVSKVEILERSWWPTDRVWKKYTAYPYWTEFNEHWFRERTEDILSGKAYPLTQREHKEQLRKNSKQNRLTQKLEVKTRLCIDDFPKGGLTY
ncbi:hypothetical protein CPC08DRAFT_767815 [Agrocybe pediades]|nr:hypothetical protein CPC08DRAFT_767815 [Agrocybe pediades]